MERSIDSGSSAAKSFLVGVSFYGDLGYFVKTKDRQQPVRRVLTHKTSVKDVIESFGVPHPEVDLIVFNGQPVDFSFRLEADAALDVYPIAADLFPSSRLQARDVRAFVADGHLGKLTRDLRLLGLDVSYNRDANDRELLATMVKENRALLTRDRPLLMHRAVKTGYFPRSQHPLERKRSTNPIWRLARVFGQLGSCNEKTNLLVVGDGAAGRKSDDWSMNLKRADWKGRSSAEAGLWRSVRCSDICV